jgi:hypothetical protein
MDHGLIDEAGKRTSWPEIDSRRETMSTALVKPAVAKPRLAKPRSEVVASRTTYRVTKAQSLRMAAYDKRVEAAEAKKAKAAEVQKAKADKKAPAI